MKTKSKIEFGDFQTPPELANLDAEAIVGLGLKPASIVEPTCGIGNFIAAACKAFPNSKTILGLETNSTYFGMVNERISIERIKQSVDLRKDDFFTFNWKKAFDCIKEPILIIGNPPWVTASELGSLESSNLPSKSNFQKHRGFDALTGKSNFDIAEWMYIHMLECLRGKNATIGMLLKTSVARKVLIHAWKTGFPIAEAKIYHFDVQKYFDIGADACLLVCELKSNISSLECQIMDLEDPEKKLGSIGYYDGILLANKKLFIKNKKLFSGTRINLHYRWRSGIKHDCSAIMEFSMDDFGTLRNGLKEKVSIEPEIIYPLLKGSDIANGNEQKPKRFMLVPQLETGQDTSSLKHRMPNAWKYLQKHEVLLARRKSSIYRNRPKFSIFGVVEYAFAPWKVAICGLYKKLEFVVVGKYDGKPIVLDDTCYQLPMNTKAEAALIAELLNSHLAKSFFEAFIFWDSKRPITAELLGRIDLMALANVLGKGASLRKLRPEIKTQCELDSLAFAAR